MASLQTWLRVATQEEREACAEQAGTTVNYLYQVAGRSINVGTNLAVRIETTTRDLKRHNRKLPVVTVKDLANI